MTTPKGSARRRASRAKRVRLVARQEHHPDPIVVGRRQLNSLPQGNLTQESVRQLEEDTRAVARVHFTAAGATVQQVDQELERLTDDGVRAMALDVDHDPDAAGVVLVPRLVEPLGPHPSEPVEHVVAPHLAARLLRGPLRRSGSTGASSGKSARCQP